MNQYEIVEVCLGAIGLFLTLAGLVLIIFGWVIPHRQKIELENKRQVSEMNLQKLKWEKELIDQQISNFYGPISALLNEQNIVRKRINFMIGRKCIFDKEHPTLSSFSDSEQKIWKHFIDFYKLPINHKIVEIIRNNKHLIYRSIVPNCFNVFMDYTLGWELLDSQRKNDVPNYYDYHYSYNFPIEFSSYIIETLNVLLKRQAEITGILGS